MTDTPEATNPGDAPAVNVQSGEPAQTVTVSREENGGEELLAGKFKSPADLEKAYVELQKKLGSGGSNDGGEGETPEAGDAAGDENDSGKDAAQSDDSNGDEDGADASIYGEAVTEVLTKAEIDPKALADHFAEHGEIGDEYYEKLEKAGFPRSMVDAYAEGLKAQNQTAEQTAEANATEIKQAAGGDDGYKELQSFVATLPQADIDAFNADVTSGDVDKAKAAVQSAIAKRTAELGKEAKLLGGDTPKGVQGFKTEAEYREAFKDPRYKTSQAYRDEVAAKLVASPHIMAGR